MAGPDPGVVVIAFNDSITRHDPDALAELMTDDHTFTDSAGGSVIGRDACREAWHGFLSAFPDYRNVFADLRVSGDTVLATGHSECADPALAGPALWRATVRHGLLATWEVRDDTPAAREDFGLPR